MKIPQYLDILNAQKIIQQFINKTPVLTCKTLNDLTNNELYFKCENFQKVGAFKYRGATNAVLQLNENESKFGVATHSSGNHAQALALAAKIKGIPAYIVMPNNSPKVKKEAVAGYGAKIIYCEPTLEAREFTLEKIVKETAAAFIHPYNNFNVICGQGTAALELINEIDNLDYVIAPVGGGGLLSGTLTAVKGISNSIKVIAAEPEGADDAKLSIEAGKIIPSINPNTIADGLLTSLCELTFEIISKQVNEIITVNDESILKAMRMIWERMKIIVEPSAATTLAILLENKLKIENKKIGLILSGGNVDLEMKWW